jgi:hypothetical protein
MQLVIPATQLFQFGYIFGRLLVETMHRLLPLDVLKYVPKQAGFLFVLVKDILRKFACTIQELRSCFDYLRSRTSVLELRVRTFPKFEAGLFPTISSPSDCTFIFSDTSRRFLPQMRLDSSLQGVEHL